MVLHYAKYDANVEMHLCIVAYRHEYPECLVIVPTVVATTSVGPFLQFIIVGIHSTIENVVGEAAVMLTLL